VEAGLAKSPHHRPVARVTRVRGSVARRVVRHSSGRPMHLRVAHAALRDGGGLGNVGGRVRRFSLRARIGARGAPRRRPPSRGANRDGWC